jgi:hypothetical protein
MNITQWYGIALGGLLISSVIFFMISSIVKLVRKYATFYFWKHILYPQIHPFFRGPNKTTRLDVIIVFGFIMGNILCITIKPKNSSDLANRAALASTINLIPLFSGGRMNSIASRCGVRYETLSRMHRWLGRVGIVESVIHASIAYEGRKDIHASSQIAGLIVG